MKTRTKFLLTGALLSLAAPLMAALTLHLTMCFVVNQKP